MTRLTWLVGLAVSALLGCGGEKACEGEEGCTCFANDTCMPGLVCLSDLCVNDDRPTSDVSRETDSSTPEPEPDSDKPSEVDSSTPEPEADSDSDEPREMDSSTPELESEAASDEPSEVDSSEPEADSDSDEPSEVDSSTPEPEADSDSDELSEMDSSTPQLKIAPNPARWFRADQGVELADGAKVSIWRDQSEQRADATMADVVRQPELLAAGLNDRPEVLFGGAQSLYFPTFNSVEFTLFAVGRNANETDFHSIIIGPGGDTGNNQLRWDNGDTLMFVGLDINIPITEIPFGNTRESHLVTVRYTGTALEAYRNAEQRGLLATVSTGGWDVAQLGGWFSQDFMIGSLSEVVMYDRSLTDAELEETQAALLEKYGL